MQLASAGSGTAAGLNGAARSDVPRSARKGGPKPVLSSSLAAGSALWLPGSARSEARDEAPGPDGSSTTPARLIMSFVMRNALASATEEFAQSHIQAALLQSGLAVVEQA
jgi:hypothetical protein